MRRLLLVGVGSVIWFDCILFFFFFFQAEDGIRDGTVTGVQTCALPISGYGAAIWLVERIGRKPTLAMFLILGGLSAFAFAVADTESVYVTALFFVGFFRSEERRVGKSVDLGGRRIIKKKKKERDQTTVI